MKKFLTVLLALSVVFTYTVGTAFAVTDQETANAKVVEVQNAAEKALNDYAATIVYNQQNKLVTPTVDANLTKAAVEAGVAKAIADKKAEIQNKAIELMADNAWSTTDSETLEALADFDCYDLVFKTNLTTIYARAIADAKADVTAAMNAVTTDGYSKADAAVIKAAKDTATAALDAVKDTNNNKAGLQAVLDAGTAFNNAVKDLKTIAAQENDLAKAKTDAKTALSTAADNLKVKAQKEYEGIINNPSNAASAIANATAKLASLDADIAKVVEFYEAEIDAVALDVDGNPAVTLEAAIKAVNSALTKGKASLANTTALENKVAELASSDLLVQYAKNYAESMKNRFDKETGLPVFNAETVDKALDAVVAKINKLDSSVNTYAKIASILESTKTAVQEAEALKTQKAAGVKAITTGNYAASKWTDENQAAIEAIQDEYTNKINAAISADEIDAAVKEAKEKMDSLLTIAKADEQKSIVDSYVATQKYAAELKKYAEGIAAKNPGAYSSDTITAIVADALEVFADAVLAQNNPKLTTAEIKAIVDANYNNALAVIDGMKTDAELDAAANAVVEAIKALPTVPTLENKAPYLAAQKMLEDYDAIPGSISSKVTNRSLLAAYMSRIIAMEKTAVEDQIKALPKNPTAADEAAVKAAQDAVKAYADAYSKYTGQSAYPYGYIAISSSTAKILDAAATAVSDAKLTEAAKKVAALPATITVEDKAAVEAAREAYDALTDAEKAVFNKDLYAKLVAAEKQLAKVDTEYQKVAVAGTHMKIYSSAAKGYIKISWKATNSEVALDGVEVYRSTKKTSGFKKISTFKVQTSKKYTTGLKKGTKYYYYVKGYKMIGDEKVYTHQSITVARTFK